MFASPRRLDLKLYCTPQRSANSKALEIWPELPIVIVVEDVKSKEGVANVIGALRQHNRVCKLYYRKGQFLDSSRFLKEFAAINEPFPALITLCLFPSQQQNIPVLPASFLGGSAPRLRLFHLEGIPYPSIGKLLSSTTNLVRLSLWDIPHSGYIAPETIVPCLSPLSRLESLDLGFRYQDNINIRANRHPPPFTRVVLPNLTSFRFCGGNEYLEDVLSRIETPVLHEGVFSFFNDQLVFDTPLLGHFIRRTEGFMTSHAAHIECFDSSIWIRLSGRKEMADDDSQGLWMGVSCDPLEMQLSALSLAQVLTSVSSSLSNLESLDIAVDREDWQCEIEVIQWRELLRLFTTVKKVTLDSNSVRLVVPALREPSGERATEVLLPALQNLCLDMDLEDWRPSRIDNEAIEQFIAARQIHGHPVTVHYSDMVK